MKGIVEIHKIDVASGLVVDVTTFNNLILTNMKNQLVRLLSGDLYDASDRKRSVAYMQFGVGTDPEESDQTALTAPIANVFPVSVDFPREDTSTDWAVRFSVILNETDANGFPIAEIGLLCEDQTLVARKVLPQVLNKTDRFRYLLFWTIEN